MKVANIYNRYRNLILYGMIGGTCAFLDFIVYSALCLVMSFLVANIISTHCGIFCSFYLNRKYNFKVEDSVIKRFLLFYAVGLFGLLVSEILLDLMVNTYSVEKLIAKIVTIIVVALLQFIMNKFITFKSKQNG